MSFWATLLALAWDQVAPLLRPCQLERLFDRYADWLHERVNAGSREHGLLAWALAALLPALAAGLLGHWLAALAWPLGLAWSAAVLYRCLGLRQLVDRARALAAALAAGDQARAAGQLGALGVEPPPGAGPDDLVRPAMEHLLRLAARLFGVLFWFLLLGPFGAVAYALSHLLAERWHGADDFHAAVAQVIPVLDWVPVRLLVLGFAVVGNFEEAMLAWRADDLDEREAAVAAGLGALGLGPEAPGPEYVAAVASLVNRTVLLWLGLLGLFWLGSL